MFPDAIDAIVLVHRTHDWSALPAERPLFACGEMFLGLTSIESRRWRLWRLREELRHASLPVAPLADFLEPEDVAWLETTAARIAHSWYLAGERDWTMYRDVSLGRCCEYDVKAHSIRILKFALACRRLVERYPGRPVYSDYHAASPEGRLLAELGVVTRPFDVQLDEQPTSPSTRPSVRNALIARGRTWGLWLLERFASLMRDRARSDCPVLVVRPGFQSVKMLERWLEQPHRVQVALWMDQLTRPRTMFSLVRAGATILPRRATEEPAAPDDLARIATEWVQSGLRLDIAGETGFPLQSAFQSLCGSAIEQDLPRYALLVDQAYDALNDPRVAALALPNDCQGPLRAWTLVAKRTKTRSIILQHGHLDYTEDEDHLLGDFSAFWSDAVRDQFIACGLRSEQIAVTGSPNVDDFAPPAMTNRRGRAAGRTRVLVITTGNPGVQAYTDETWVADYIVRVLADICDGSGRFDVAVKLHPGESVALYTQHIEPWLAQVSSLRDRGKLTDWLAWADVVISPPSTVVLEARASGVPVILLPLTPLERRPISLAHLEGVMTLGTDDSIAEAIHRIERADSSVVAGTDNSCGSSPLPRYVGPLDGEASLRLLRVAERIALSGELVRVEALAASEVRHV